jgi:hypothetical protein
MKTIFTLLLASVFTSAFAMNEGRITITVPSKNMEVNVDGRTYQSNDNSFVLTGVQPGNHSITVYRISQNGNGYGRNNKRNNSRNDVIYSSTIYVRPSYDVDVMINRFGKALVDEQALNSRNGRQDDDDYNGGYNNGGYNNGGYKNGGYDNGGNNNGDYNNNGYQAMNDYDFQASLQKVRNQWLGKLGSARDLVNKNYLNVYQVKQVVQLFSSESDKLELAKLSYKNIVDRQNFRQLYDQFSYQSQSELDRFVRDSRF